MSGTVLLRRMSLNRVRVAAIGGCYLAGLVVIANVAFGTTNFFTASGAAPARTGGYDTRLPIVGPVDPTTIAKAITEATGGKPTIGTTLPPPQPPAKAHVTARTGGAAPISITTTPTYTATAKTATVSPINLLTLIPFLRFPAHARPHRHS